MFGGVLFFSVLMGIVTISLIRKESYIDFNIKKYFKDYIGIITFFFITFYALISVAGGLGGFGLSFCVTVFVGMIYPKWLEDREKKENEFIIKKEFEKEEQLKRELQEEEENKRKSQLEQENKRKSQLEQERLKRKFQEEQERMARKKADKEAYERQLNKYILFISELKSTVNIFDTNIFMDKEYEQIFNLFINENIKILMTEKQFEEIVNLKNSSVIEKNVKSRYALNIIDLLSKKNIINIGFKSLSLDIDNKAYADPEIFEFCLKISEKHKVNFITNDRVLSIKTTQLSRKNNTDTNLQVFNGNEFLQFIDSCKPIELYSGY